MDKRYVARLRLGEETDTLDPEGEVIAVSGVPSRKTIEKAVAGFYGSIQQVPPEYSAVHTSGVRAYKLARAGKEVELKPRTVHIYRLDIVEFEPPELTICVHCSKGTYIRSLARDIGRAAGSRAHVSALRRTHVGLFSVSEARPPERIVPERDTINATDVLGSLGSLQTASVSAEVARRVKNGAKIDVSEVDKQISDGEIVITSRTGEVLAIVEKRGNSTHYRMVVPQ